MRIGEAASRAGVNVETMRYYERRGLLRAPARKPSGYRSYGEETVTLVRFIKRSQELGFSLADIEELLPLIHGGAESCRGVRALVTTKIADLDGRIATLRAMRKALVSLAETCEQPRTTEECPVIAAIEETA